MGLAGGALVAERAGAPVRDVLAQSVLSRAGLVLVAAIALAAQPRCSSRPSPRIEGGSVGAAWRGSTSPPSRPRCSSSSRSAAETTTASSSCCSRRSSPLSRRSPPRAFSARRCELAERLTRGRSLGLRFAILSLDRNPGYAIAATSFLVVSFGLALFAETLPGDARVRASAIGAAYAVPRDFVVQEDLRRLIPVLDAAPLGRLRALGPGTEVDPVLRATGAVGSQEGEIRDHAARPAAGLAGEAARLAFGLRRGRAGRARRGDRGAVTGTAGSGSGSTTRAIVIRTTGPDLRLTAQVRTVGGRFLRLELGPTGARTLRAAVPREARGGLARRPRARAGHEAAGARCGCGEGCDRQLPDSLAPAARRLDRRRGCAARGQSCRLHADRSGGHATAAPRAERQPSRYPSWRPHGSRRSQTRTGCCRSRWAASG